MRGRQKNEKEGRSACCCPGGLIGTLPERYPSQARAEVREETDKGDGLALRGAWDEINMLTAARKVTGRTSAPSGQKIITQLPGRGGGSGDSRMVQPVQPPYEDPEDDFVGLAAIGNYEED